MFDQTVIAGKRKTDPFGFSHRQVACAFSDRDQGNMSLVYGDVSRALDNRKNFLAGLNVDYCKLVCAKQIHSGNVYQAGKTDAGKGAEIYDTSVPDTDALITNQKNLPLAIFTADCLCVFLFDPKASVIGLAHAGWRSAKDNIINKAIGIMRDKYSCSVEDIRVTFGPAIRKCCFQVGQEFRDYFPGKVECRKGVYYLDLAGVNRSQAIESGVKLENISDCGICTYCRGDEFFSYRKQGRSTGRSMAVLMLK